MAKQAKNTICLWYDGGVEDAARFYAETFPDSSAGAVHRAPGDFPSGKKGDALTVEFTVMGIPCLGLNGGPAVKHNEAFSFQVATADQAETDRYWDAIVGNGGQEGARGAGKGRRGGAWTTSRGGPWEGDDATRQRRARHALPALRGWDGGGGGGLGWGVGGLAGGEVPRGLAGVRAGYCDTARRQGASGHATARDRSGLRPEVRGGIRPAVVEAGPAARRPSPAH